MFVVSSRCCSGMGKKQKEIFLSEVAERSGEVVRLRFESS